MTEDEVASEICTTFERGESMWGAVDVSPQVASVVYWQSALENVISKPFDREFIQIKVKTFLDMKLQHAQERLIREPLEKTKELLQKLED